MGSLRTLLIALLSYVVKRLYDFVLLLRLFVLVLEREDARSGHGNEAQQTIDNGT